MQTKLSYNWTWLSLFSWMDSCGTQEYAIFANSSGIWPRMLLARDFFNLGILSRVIIQVGRYNNVTAGIPLLQPVPAWEFPAPGQSGIPAHKDRGHIEIPLRIYQCENPIPFPSPPRPCYPAITHRSYRKYLQHIFVPLLSTLLSFLSLTFGETVNVMSHAITLQSALLAFWRPK